MPTSNGTSGDRPGGSEPPAPAERDLRWEYFRASGPGGQRRNKVATAVRLTHLPSGVTVTASERRSRRQNREVALRRLKERLAGLNRPRKPRKPTRPGAAARRRRLEEKRARSRIKALRRRPAAWD